MAYEQTRTRLEGFHGALIDPDHPDYEAGRRVWNGMIDRRPALIARCKNSSDVKTALAYAREEGLPIAVRGGAHNVAGNATVDGGVVLDLSPMKAIDVDAQRRIAWAEAGLTWSELDAATYSAGLATTGGLVSSTGIAGFTLGGGIGWLMRKHGLTIDNLLGADVLTANGDSVRATASENADLFWALRGGGGNFGIVTRFEYQLHPVTHVLGGLTMYPAARAGAVLRYFRELSESAPDELTLLLAFLYAPPAPFVPDHLRLTPVVAIAVCYTGDSVEGERVLRSLKSFGPPAVDLVGPMPYPGLQSMFDAGAPPGMQQYWKSSYLSALSDAAIDTLVDHAARIRSPMSQVHLHQMGGAVARVPPGVTAFTHREAAFTFNIIGTWPEPTPEQKALHTRWVQDFAEAMTPYGTGGVYVNFLGDEGEDRVRAAYGEEAFRRLTEVKRIFDPGNLFRLNQNIRPHN